MKFNMKNRPRFDNYFRQNIPKGKVKITKEEVLGCFFIDPLFGQVTVGHSGSHKGSKTFWFTFMKIPEEASSTVTITSLVRRFGFWLNHRRKPNQ